MDRSWVHASRITDVYQNSIEEFLNLFSEMQHL